MHTLRSLGPALAALLALAATAPAATPCGTHAWCNASLSPERRADLLLSQMTLDEKFELMAGDDPQGLATGNPANGTSNGIPRLGIPTMYFNDGPAGIREGRATAMPAPIGLAATFSPDSALRYGTVVGREGFAKGGHVIHAPAVNIARVPQSGRTFEYFGEDPHVAARTAVPYIHGLQRQGVIGNVKHYVANNQETDRFVTNAIVDERTLREIYVPAFEASVKEGRVGSAMLSYNRVNGEPVTDSKGLVNGLLKRELGLHGFALTDYAFAQRSTAAASNAGTDLEMPQAGFFAKPPLAAAVATGGISMAEIDEHLHRILRTMFRFKVFDRALPDNGPVDVAGHGRAAREVAEDAAVLLKNERDLLPLDARKLRSLAVIGPEADAYRTGGGSSQVNPYYVVTPLAGIRERAGRGVDVRHDAGREPERAAEVARGADAAVVVVNDNQSEFADKPCLSLQCGDPTNGDQDGLIRAVARANKNTIVLLETGGPVLMPWIDDVPAALEAWYPGEEGGHAIAGVLFGDAEPGGRLPVTFPRREEDTPLAGHPERYPGVAEDARYDEGVFVGYRHYDQNRIAPLFPFGHGLSYTRFRIAKLKVRRLYRGRVRVIVSVRNIGRRAGSEVVQLYLGMPDPSSSVRQPPHALKGFRKVRLRPGRKRRVAFTLDRRAFSYWDASRHRWAVAPGCYGVHVGTSSRSLPLGRRITSAGRTCR